MILQIWPYFIFKLRANKWRWIPTRKTHISYYFFATKNVILKTFEYQLAIGVSCLIVDKTTKSTTKIYYVQRTVAREVVTLSKLLIVPLPALQTASLAILQTSVTRHVTRWPIAPIAPSWKKQNIYTSLHGSMKYMYTIITLKSVIKKTSNQTYSQNRQEKSTQIGKLPSS